MSFHFVKEAILKAKVFMTTNHRHLKLISFLIAGSLWIFITNQGRTEKEIAHIPCNIQKVPDNLVLVSYNIQSVSIKVRGLPNTIYNIKVEGLSANITIPTDLTPGSHIIAIDPQMINIPAGLEVVSIQPPVIEITLEEKIERMVPIHPDLRGFTKTGYELTRITSTPSMVRVLGAASVVSNLNYVFTEPIDISSKSASFQQSVALKTDLQLVDIKNEKTTAVTVEITEKASARVVDSHVVVEDKALTSSKVTEVDPSVVQMILIGQEQSLQQLDPEQMVSISIDSSTEIPEFIAPNVLRVPDNVVVKAIIPAKVKITTVENGQKKSTPANHSGIEAGSESSEMPKPEATAP